MTDLTIPDEAVEAAASTYYVAPDEGVSWERLDEAAPCLANSIRRYMHRALTAALPILHPTIPNTVEALDALPDGAILRAELGSGAISATRDGDKWGTAGSGWLHISDELARHYSRITEWTVLWPLGDTDD